MCAQSRLTLGNTMNCVEFSRQEYWSGLPCPSPGIKPKFPVFLALPVDSLPLSYQGRFCRMLFPGGSDSKESTYNAGDLDSIPGLGRSPGNPLQYSCLENPHAQRSQGHRVGHDWGDLAWTHTCCIIGTSNVIGQLYFKNKQTHRKGDQICGS